MAGEFPINRIANFFDPPTNAIYEGFVDGVFADQILADISRAAEVFSLGDASSEPDEPLLPDNPFVARLLWLMIDEAMREKAFEIELQPHENKFAVLYKFADGSMKNRDHLPERFYAVLLLAIERMTVDLNGFQHEGRVQVTVLRNSDSGGGLRLQIDVIDERKRT